MPLHPKGSTCVRPGLYYFDRGVTLYRTDTYQAEGSWNVIASGLTFSRGSHGIRRFWQAAAIAKAMVKSLEKEGLSGDHFNPDAPRKRKADQ